MVALRRLGSTHPADVLGSMLDVKVDGVGARQVLTGCLSWRGRDSQEDGDCRHEQSQKLNRRLHPVCLPVYLGVKQVERMEAFGLLGPNGVVRHRVGPLPINSRSAACQRSPRPPHGGSTKAQTGDMRRREEL